MIFHLVGVPLVKAELTITTSVMRMVVAALPILRSHKEEVPA